MGPIDPAFFEDGDVRAALAARDIGALYRLLRRVGLSQRRIAHLTGQSQSEVSEILKGRQVLNVRVLERIADGLDIPRTRMG
ncbi:MAG TPA: helix-turn-helix transcriptional regulator, partial [Pseudonocardiaceae bacterium]|nr:helix-turn-helix transcriptional regulator [Pseudonocardiaceae bacterium]